MNHRHHRHRADHLVLGLCISLSSAALVAATPDAGCGSHATPDDVARVRERLQLGMYDQPGGIAADVVYHVPIAVHVVRPSNTFGGLSEDAVAATLADANAAFGPAGIVFCKVGETIYIDDDDYYYSTNTLQEIDALRQELVIPDAINVYFTQELAFPGIPLCGISSFTGSVPQGIVMRNSCTAAGGNHSTFTHEIGHYFDLFHTHETAFGVECVDGGNCDVAGDLVCDTAADPQVGSGSVNWSTCEYIGSSGPACITDSSPYDPPVDNFMSYAPSHCRDTFTPEQITRMRTTLEVFRPELALFDCPGADFEPTPGMALESVSSKGVAANGPCASPSVSADGRFVAFCSDATTLVDGTVVPPGQVYLRDRVAGETTLISRTAGGEPANGSCATTSISGDGRFVAFTSTATNLVPEETFGYQAVYLLDRESGEISLCSKTPSGTGGSNWSWSPSIARDGGALVFRSFANDLLPGDANGLDLFLYDIETEELTMVGVASDGTQANGACFLAALTPDARYVVFGSMATNLDPKDTNEWSDVYRHDRLTGETMLVGIGSEGELASFGTSNPTISGDGRFVSFMSWGTGLIPDDANQFAIDVVVKDLETNTLEIVSRGIDGSQANQSCTQPQMSLDGRFVTYLTNATNMGFPDDADDEYDVYVRDRELGVTILASPGGEGAPSAGWADMPVISADGSTVVFVSDGGNLVPQDGNTVDDVFSFIVPGAHLADLDGDGVVNGADLSVLLSAWGTAAAAADLDGDGLVGPSDLGLLLAAWTG